MLRRFLPKRPKPRTRNRQATDAPVIFALRDTIDQACAQRQQAGVHATRADAADPEIVGQQRIARRDDLHEAVQHALRAVDGESEHDEGRGVKADHAQDDVVRERCDGGLGRAFRGHPSARAGPLSGIRIIRMPAYAMATVMTGLK